MSLGLYVLIYVILSIAGEYDDNVSVLAKIEPPCLCISDLNEWQPLFVVAAHSPPYGEKQNRRRATNVLGFIFLLLLVLDQRFWHKSTWIHLPDLQETEG